MELRQLRLFVLLAEEGSMSRAAVKGHLSQQHLSRVVAALERDLGVLLFERTPRGVQLTRTGEALLGHARDVLLRAERLRAAARQQDPGGRPLRVGFPDWEDALRLWRRGIRAFRAQASHQTVLGAGSGWAKHHLRVRDDQLDVGLGLSVTAEEFGGSVAYLPVRSEVGSFAMLSADHRCASWPSVALADLRDTPYGLIADASASVHNARIGSFERAGAMPRAFVSTDGVAEILLHVYSGSVWTTVTESVARTPLPDVAYVPLEDPAEAVETRMFVVWNPASAGASDLARHLQASALSDGGG